MLFDVFICHASEDKEEFVRPLAKHLQDQNVRVWYDEFSLKIGDSIRRSIDKGLSQSRFGIVVISPSFLKKQWTQYELDGLVEREIYNRGTVILPVWFNVNYSEVITYSPSLANKKAAIASDGLTKVAKEILDVIHPQGSPLLEARDTLIAWGVSPPVVTDEYWIDIIEASNRAYGFGATIPPESIWGRWSFPLPPKTREPKQWGERLAWTAMQIAWCQAGGMIPITPVSEPVEVLHFIDQHPGLLETCIAFPELAAEYAPQLTIKGMGGDLESTFEAEYQKSAEEQVKEVERGSHSGTGLTIGKKVPACNITWAFRDTNFGWYRPDVITYEYFNGGMFGPQVSPFYDADHLFWLLSKKSSWLPRTVHNCLLTGMMHSTHWIWGRFHGADRGGNWKTNGKLLEKLRKSEESIKRFEWDKQCVDDVTNRLGASIKILSLPETPEQLFKKFADLDFPNHWISKDTNGREKRATKRKKS
jgi:hypothetical protein